MKQEFSRYLHMTSAAARPVLNRPSHGDPPHLRPWEAPLALGVAPALSGLDEPAPDDTLAAGCRRLAEVAGAALIAERPVMLRAPDGHGRTMYHPLVLHLHLAAFARQYEQMSNESWAACEEWLTPALTASRHIESYADTAPPMDHTATVLWHALCIYEHAKLMGRDADIELIEGLVHAIIARPTPRGSLLPQTNDDAIDLWMFEELAALHALTHLALQSRSRSWSARVATVAAHHVEYFQPDYTTSQPWGLMAFVWSGHPSFADQQLHDAATYGEGGSVSLIAALLLADAAAMFGPFAECV